MDDDTIYDTTIYIMESDLCLDFTCPGCGFEGHTDTNEESIIVCGSCGAKWEMEASVSVTLTRTTNPHGWREATVYTDEQVKARWPVPAIAPSVASMPGISASFPSVDEWDTALRNRITQEG